MNWCWIIPIIVGLITALLGYFFGRWSRQQDVNGWREKYDIEKEKRIATKRKIPVLEKDLLKARESDEKSSAAYDELKGRFELLQNEWDKNRTIVENLKDENKDLKHQLAECKKSISKPNEDV